LGHGIAILGGLTVPAYGLVCIALDAFTVGIGDSQPVLGAGVPQFGSLLKVLESLAVILADTVTKSVGHTHFIQGLRISAVCIACRCVFNPALS
jgi:hypothetical protein